MARRDGVCVTACERCPALVASRTQIVNGTGPTDADLLFVGEGPGADEDRQGEPFVGRSGEVLNEVLSEVGLSREAVRITNCVRCRPPDNRDPTDAELDNCREFLEAEVASVDPALVVTLGKTPSQHLLGRSVAVTSEAGDIERVEFGGTERRVVVCVHPAASLYDPSQRETLASVISTVAAMVGVDPPEADPDGEDQSRLSEF